MSSLPRIALGKHAPPEFYPRAVQQPDDDLKQWQDLRFLMYCELDRLRSGAGDASIYMMLLASDMAELAGHSDDLALKASALALSDFLAKVGPTPTGFQMAELRSILACFENQDCTVSENEIQSYRLLRKFPDGRD